MRKIIKGEDLKRKLGAPEAAADPLEFNGKRVLVTGGTKGIGEVVVSRFRDTGVSVITTARSRPGNLTDANLFIAANVATVDGCAAVATAVIERLGGIDIIVHVVGGSSAPAAGFAILDDTQCQRALDLNLFPAVRLDRALFADDAQSGLWGDYPYHVNPAPHVVTRGGHRLCGG